MQQRSQNGIIILEISSSNTKDIDKLTSTNKAVDRTDLSTKSARVTATTVTESLAIGLGTES